MTEKTEMCNMWLYNNADITINKYNKIKELHYLLKISLHKAFYYSDENSILTLIIAEYGDDKLQRILEIIDGDRRLLEIVYGINDCLFYWTVAADFSKQSKILLWETLKKYPELLKRQMKFWFVKGIPSIIELLQKTEDRDCLLIALEIKKLKDYEITS